MTRHSFINAAKVLTLAGLSIFQFPAQAEGNSTIPGALLVESERVAQGRVEESRIFDSLLPDSLTIEIPHMAVNMDIIFASLDAEAAKLIERQKQLQALQSLDVPAPVKVLSHSLHRQLVKLGE
jgi:hypothetical protein